MTAHRESNLQIRCVAYFRATYPAFARLLEHPHNEGNGFNRLQQSIANREGVTKGVADLILHVPSFFKIDATTQLVIKHSLAIELKDGNRGKQSLEQKTWQRLFEAAGGMYVVIRDYDDFTSLVDTWMKSIPLYIKKAVEQTHKEIIMEEDEKVRQQLKKLVNKRLEE